MNALESSFTPNTAPRMPFVPGYRVLRKIGQGYFGEVYLATHRLLRRHVAVKILKREHVGRSVLVRRFLREAQSASAVRHPGVVEVYDLGTLEGGGVFIVMELLEGESLRARLMNGAPVAFDEAIEIIRQLAEALAAVHRAGIVHRDVKPENIFLCSGTGAVKLVDFGVAKLMRERCSPGEPTLTRKGNMVGTPAYMAPEQVRGTGLYDSRTDLYALGCVAFELLAGRQPFQARFTGEIMAAHVKTPPPRLGDIDAAIPEDIDALVNRLLAKEPADRLASADQVVAALDACRDHGQTMISGMPTMCDSMSLGFATLVDAEVA